MQRDKDGVQFARKAMIRCGLALNLNEQWERRQLFLQLQIINKYQENFNGTPVNGDGADKDGEVETDA